MADDSNADAKNNSEQRSDTERLILENDMRLRSKRLANLIPYKPGQTGNPLGASIHNKKLNEVRLLTREELTSMASILLKSDVRELKRILDDDKQTILRMMLAAVAYKTITTGDIKGLDLFLDRIIGKPKEMTEIIVDRKTENDPQLVHEAFNALKSCK